MELRSQKMGEKPPSSKVETEDTNLALNSSFPFKNREVKNPN